MSTGDAPSPDGDGLVVDLGDLSALRDGQVHTCSSGDLDIMVCRVAGTLYAIEDRCSHAETTLSDGVLTGPNIACPLHGASFDVRDGRHLGPPAYTGVRTFPVMEQQGLAQVEIRPPKRAEPDPTVPPMRFRTR